MALMKIGMLWLDSDKSRTLDEKVKRAADYYQDKYGILPELCLVNTLVIESEKKVGDVRVQPAGTVLKDHFWLGMAAGA